MMKENKSATTIILRKSKNRGHADHGWLDSYHTFSFAGYYDKDWNSFGPLRVLNEDRVEAGSGFPSHPHSNYEIFSYIVSGELSHKDSMGHVETIRRGDVQFTSAGTGIVHSEYNRHEKDTVHFLQIWVKPDKLVKPSYKTMTFSDDKKKGKLVPIVSSAKTTEESIPINQDVTVYASILQKSQKIDYTLKKGRKLHLHLIQTKDAALRINIAAEVLELRAFRYAQKIGRRNCLEHRI